jgi:hypothetical protein
MAQYKYTIKDYWLRNEKLSKEEFNYYKKLLQSDQNVDILPKKSFWKEFPILLYSIGAILIGIPLVAIDEAFSFLPGLGIASLIFFFIFNIETMTNYFSYVKRRNKKEELLKSILLDCSDFSEYNAKYKEL